MKISISWQLSDPPIDAKDWQAVSPAPTNQDELAKALGAPGGAIDYLQGAFVAEMPRFRGWATDDPGAQWAARIYKRGVPCKGVTKTPQSGQYEIELVDDFDKALAKIQKDAFFIVDEEVAKAWPKIPSHVQVLATEGNKTLDTVADILETEAQTPNKHWIIIGGGITGDAAAFAAALAGKPMTLVPTTLLAMADACVGGKTGVNFPPFGKNQIGRFYFPRQVLVSTQWFATLPARHFRAGIAECLKHCYLCGDMKLADAIVQAGTDVKKWRPLLPAIIQVKADVIARDAAETGERATLNLGHTLAHALEAIALTFANQDDAILHGEAVAQGLSFAALLSEHVRGLPHADQQQVQDQLRDSGCLMSRADLEKALGRSDLTSTGFIIKLLELMRHDKKATGSAIRFITLERLGKVHDPDGSFSEAIGEDVITNVWTNWVDALDNS